MFRVVLAIEQFMDDPKLRPLEDDDYVAFGLACCFVMNDDLKLEGEFRCCINRRTATVTLNVEVKVDEGVSCVVPSRSACWACWPLH